MAVVFVAAVAASVLASSTVHRPPVEQEENFLLKKLKGAIGAMTHKVVSNTAFAASTPTIVTASLPQLGDLQGECTPSSSPLSQALSCKWLNIPYADPFSRFSPSSPRTKPYPPGAGGAAYGPACFQFGGPLGVGMGPSCDPPSTACSEDCLCAHRHADGDVHGFVYELVCGHV